MSQYYVETRNGSRGPYTERRIIEGVKAGRIPTGARIRHAQTNQTMRAVDLYDRQPDDSGGRTPVQPSGPAGQAGPQYPRQKAPDPRQHPYPSQQASPQQPYPNQPQYPYPGQGYGAQPGYGNQYQPYGNQQQSYPHYRPPPTSGLAIASLVLSLSTLMVGCVPLWIGGIICGVLALNECEPKGEKSGRGMALAGLWTGIGLGVLTVLCVLFFFSMGTF